MYTTTQHNNLTVSKITLGAMATNCYFVSNTASREAIIVDPADSGEFLLELISELRLKPTAIVFTHAHFDHVLGSLALSTMLQIPTWLHPADVPLLARAQKNAQYWLKHQVDPVPPASNLLARGTIFCLGSETLKVIHLPGHTPGGMGIGLFNGDATFICCGDLITDEGLSRADHSYSRPSDLIRSLKLLLKLPIQTTYYPGHGDPLNQTEVQTILADHLLSGVQ